MTRLFKEEYPKTYWILRGLVALMQVLLLALLLSLSASGCSAVILCASILKHTWMCPVDIE